MYTLSKKSLEKLQGVHINLINFMKELIEISPWDFKITYGVRTATEQNKLYQSGRTIPGPWKTNCDGYKKISNHQTKIDGLGYAVDIGVLIKEKNGKIVYKGDWKDFHYYQDIYNTAKKAGLIEKYSIEWGGTWKNRKDGPHFQILGADNVPYQK